MRTFMTVLCVLMVSTARAEDSISLEQSLALARAQAPSLAAEQAAIGVARGQLRASHYWLPSEPELTVELAPRRSDTTSATDSSMALAQRFELLGQRGDRIHRAERLLEAAAADYATFERNYLALVADAYLETAGAIERLDLARRAEAEGREADTAAAGRYDTGDIALLDRNLAAIELARLERERWRVEGEAEGTRAELAYLLGLDSSDARSPTSLAEALPALEGGLEAALDWTALARERTDIRSARAQVGAQEAEVSILRAERGPDLVLSAGREREGGTDRLTRFGASVSIPLFRRNRGEIASALAELDHARATLALSTRAAERDVARATARRQASAGALAAVRERMAERAEENLGLAASSYEAGKIGLLDLILVRRAALEGLGTLVESRLEYGQALVELRRAAGLPAPGLEAPAAPVR